ncbi:MAG TPA: phage tail tape measure protein [Pseudolabrys sp.]|nr:phage tail tape measure protein [Pseudolabrys sp.]
MSDSYGFDDGGLSVLPGDLPDTVDKARGSTNALGVSATQFASSISKAFAQATTGGKQFDDVLKSLALKLSNMAVRNAFKPLAKDLGKGLQGLFGDVFGGGGGSTNSPDVPTPFASGGVINTPSYFPLSSGGLGLAGEAGPEAIVPLSRGADGRLGIAGGQGQGANITVQIATPDPGSFRRSEAYITGQIARAVARGQRSL